MKVCFIGACGHVKQAYQVLKNRPDTVFCGMAPGSEHEHMAAAIDPAIPFYPDWRKMLEICRPELAIVSPVFGLTGGCIIECAKRGIDVFAEKPVASSPEELKKVERAVKESGIRFCAMHYLRYTPAFYHAAEMVRNGAVGEVRMLTAQKSYRFGRRPAWYGDRALYGGTIPWVGIHAIDWVYHFSGKRFLSVSAQQYGSPEMAALCRFEMEDDVMSAVNLDFYRPAKAPTHGDDRIRCAGTEGVLEVRDGKILLINADGVHEDEPREAPELLTEFLDGRTPISPTEIFYLTGVALAARASADSGKTVKIEE